MKNWTSWKCHASPRVLRKVSETTQLLFLPNLAFFHFIHRYWPQGHSVINTMHAKLLLWVCPGKESYIHSFSKSVKFSKVRYLSCNWWRLLTLHLSFCSFTFPIVLCSAGGAVALEDSVKFIWKYSQWGLSPFFLAKLHLLIFPHDNILGTTENKNNLWHH